jgi:hypothetical protein
VLYQLSYARRLRRMVPRSVLFFATFLAQYMSARVEIIFSYLHSFGSFGLFCRAIQPRAGFHAFKPNVFACHLIYSQKQSFAGFFGEAVFSDGDYSTIFVTTPEPTVFPPSLIAKRTFSVIAIGLPRTTETLTLSPGMHISAPPRRLASPVTSVVRK